MRYRTRRDAVAAVFWWAALIYLTMFWWAAGALLWSIMANAHAAKSGWEYPSGCCSSPEDECHEVPAKTIVGSYINNTGQRMVTVTFEPGDHPNVKAKITFNRGIKWFQQSGDSEHHACISVEGTALYCYFWQAGG